MYSLSFVTLIKIGSLPVDRDFFCSGGACVIICLGHALVYTKSKRCFFFFCFCFCLFAPAQFVKSAPLSSAATLNPQGTGGVSTMVRRLIRIPQIRFPVRIPAVLSKVLNAPLPFRISAKIVYDVTGYSTFLLPTSFMAGLRNQQVTAKTSDMMSHF